MVESLPVAALGVVGAPRAATGVEEESVSSDSFELLVEALDCCDEVPIVDLCEDELVVVEVVVGVTLVLLLELVAVVVVEADF